MKIIEAKNKYGIVVTLHYNSVKEAIMRNPMLEEFKEIGVVREE